jgi:hypothetical protein
MLVSNIGFRKGNKLDGGPISRPTLMLYFQIQVHADRGSIGQHQ